MPAADQISLIADVLMAIASLAAVVVGILGLRTWRAQMKGQAGYDSARRILRATYKSRDAFSDARAHRYKDPSIYRSFFAELSSVLRELESESLEAAMLWESNSTLPTVQELKECAADLKRAITFHLYPELLKEEIRAKALFGGLEVARDYDNGRKLWGGDEPAEEFEQRKNEAVSKREDDVQRDEEQWVDETLHRRPAKDDFAIRVEKAVRKIEETLKPHLHQ